MVSDFPYHLSFTAIRSKKMDWKIMNKMNHAALQLPKGNWITIPRNIGKFQCLINEPSFGSFGIYISVILWIKRQNTNL